MRSRLRSGTAALIALSAGLAACGGRATPGQLEPATRYSEAMRAYRHGDYRHAQERFNQLLYDVSGRDPMMPKIRFYLAESFFGVGDYVQATREFRRVADDFPDDTLASYGLLRSADCEARLWRRYELDPTHGEAAVTAYQELLQRYPDSPAARLGEVRMRAIQEWFARKDFENGQFYFRRGAYDSAILYFRNLIATYPAATMVPDAFVMLVRAYRQIGYREEREETCEHLRQYYGGRADVREVCGAGSPGR